MAIKHSAPRERRPEEPDKSAKTEDDGTTRVSFYVKDGKIVTERMRSKTRDDVRALLADPSAQAFLGVQPVSATPLSATPDPAWAMLTGPLLDVVSMLSMTAAIRLTKCSPIEAQVMRITGVEKTVLADPLARVLDKYCGTSMLKYSDEVALTLAFATIFQAKMEALKDALEIKAARRASMAVVPRDVPHVPQDRE